MMMCCRSRFGIVAAGVLALVVIPFSAAHALSSSSFTLTQDIPNEASGSESVSPTFTLEGGLNWTGKPLTSQGFSIVSTPPAGAGSSSSSSVSSDTPEEQTGGSTSSGDPVRSGGGGRGPVTGSPGSSSASSTSSAPSRGIVPRPSAPGTGDDASPDGIGESGVRDGAQTLSGLASADLPAEGFAFFDAIDGCPLHPAPVVTVVERAPFRTEPVARVNDFLLVITGGTTIGLGRKIKKDQHRLGRGKRKSRRAVSSHGIMHGILLFIGMTCIALGAGMTALSMLPTAHAEQTVPRVHVYNGHLLDSDGNPVTTAHSIRFSYWKSADALAGDIDGAGMINTGATQYAGWQETHTVTPDARGYFSVSLGTIASLPDLSSFTSAELQNLFLQVEVKTSAAADTAYETLDPDPDDTSVDRTRIASVPFSLNADTLDTRSIGTGSGAIPILQTGGVLPVSTLPGGTNADIFTIDADDSNGSSVTLRFGEALGKTLTYDAVSGLFRINDDLRIEGNLTVTGLVNGVDVSTLQSATGALKAFSGGGLNLNVSRGSYRLRGTVTHNTGSSISLSDDATNYVFFGSGGLTADPSGFPLDESFIPIAEVTTSGGGVQSVNDVRVLSSDDREQATTVTFNPAYEKAAYQADGTSNVGQLSIDHDNITLQNFYKWTSTRSSLQDYDILLRVSLPEDFVRWETTEGNPVSFAYRSTSADASENALDMQIYDTNGSPVTLSGSVTGLASTSWTTQHIAFTGAPTWTPGQEFLVRIRLYAKDTFQMQLGRLRLRYVELKGG